MNPQDENKTVRRTPNASVTGSNPVAPIAMSRNEHFDYELRVRYAECDPMRVVHDRCKAGEQENRRARDG